MFQKFSLYETAEVLTSDNSALSVTQILDIVLPYPTGCRSCGQRQIALKRLAFAEWIEKHRDLTDKEIIERLKRMI